MNTGRTRFKKGQKKSPNAFSFYKGYKQSDEHKRKIGLGNKGHHSINEFKKGHIGYKGGWIDGRTPKSKLLRQSLEYAIWRNEVYKRDHWTCRLCNKKCGKNIIAHHLKLFSEFPELRFVIDNGITLCRSCHARLHKLLKLKNHDI